MTKPFDLVELVARIRAVLRRKVDTPDPGLIHTVRGVGYVLRTPPGP
ncbi:hypothetical protein [Actinomadura sp. B10D3]